LKFIALQYIPLSNSKFKRDYLLIHRDIVSFSAQMNKLAILKEIKELDEVPESDLQWLLDQSTTKELVAGDFLFKPGDPIDELHIILIGKIALKVVQNNTQRIAAQMEQGSITSLLPYSRAKEAIGYGEAVEDTVVLVLHREYFSTMINEHHHLTEALVHVMSSRIRSFTKQQQQSEKMMALGKLSAGLAHELNNPSAAVVRSSKELQKHMRYIPEGFKRVIKISMNDEEVDKVNEIIFNRLSRGIISLNMMERSSIVDELMDWLDDQDMDDSDEMAENLVDFGITIDDLEEIQSTVNNKDLGAVLRWLTQVLTTEKLVDEIQNASQRINELVGSVKSYTHMDQANERQTVNLHEGIDNTLKMLNHKIRKSEIQVSRDYDENGLEANVFPGEMNQVWTNIIDNAIDAMESTTPKILHIHTKKDHEFVNVYIEDSGSGIPAEIQSRIFDPFFTTKEIGKGTGLGLELVHQIVRQQHNGQIYLNSEPGKTEFMICLPING